MYRQSKDGATILEEFDQIKSDQRSAVLSEDEIELYINFSDNSLFEMCIKAHCWVRASTEKVSSVLLALKTASVVIKDVNCCRIFLNIPEFHIAFAPISPKKNRHFQARDVKFLRVFIYLKGIGRHKIF